MKTTRRRFLGQSGLLLAGAACLKSGTALASPMNLPIGFQAFEIIPDLTRDWHGTWKTMASYGYKFTDLVTFGGRNPELSKYSPTDVRQTLEDAGLYCDNCHFSFNAWTTQFDATIRAARDLKLKTVVCSPSQARATADDWKRMAGQLNVLGQKLKNEGFPGVGYHNHEVEFRSVEGQIPWDLLMANTDRALVQFQIDVGNLTFGGGDALAYLTKYSDRYFSIHLKDVQPGKASVPVGAGILDWNKIFVAAKKANIRSYVTEVGAYGADTLDGAPLEPADISIMESFRRSFIFVNNYKDA